MATDPEIPVQDIILASASVTRAAMLCNAGIAITAETARLDEAPIKSAMLAEGASARDIADYLAELKARRVAQHHPGKLVIGCDQVLVLGGKLFSKPDDLADARTQLLELRGKTHELLSAAVIFENGHPAWRHIGRARLAMRSFSDRFLDEYLEQSSESILQSVGCYQLESSGAQLFNHVDGDYFSVLGLPLLEVLGFLRARGKCRE